MAQSKLIPHLFRTEFGKISSVLSRLFGLENMQLAEDIASETFLQALENWPYHGIPANPTAWLYSVAKNKTRNYLQRQQLFRQKIAVQLKPTTPGECDVDLSASNIMDSQLQMLFTLCHPAISAEAQIALSLRILCGFGIEEIADAFLTSKETINKRLYRGKGKLREAQVEIAMPSPAEMEVRLDAVLTTIYLLFNEGYYSESNEAIIREDLCQEAMRLTEMLLANDQACFPKVHALYALMCFQASRFAARKNRAGELVLYDDQDEKLWDQALIAKAAQHLKLASTGNQLSAYHLEATIACWHTLKADDAEKWEHILQLYNRLLQIQYSPVAALNRTYALSRARGKEQAMAEALRLQLYDNRYYYVLLAELVKENDLQKAAAYLQKALELAKTQADKALIRKKMDGLKA